MPPIRVVVVDDEAAYVSAIEALVETLGTAAIVGTASGVHSGIELLERCAADIALIDVNMPEGGGFAVAEMALDRGIETTLVLVSAQQAPPLPDRLTRAGVRFVEKDAVDASLFEIRGDDR